MKDLPKWFTKSGGVQYQKAAVYIIPSLAEATN